MKNKKNTNRPVLKSLCTLKNILRTDVAEALGISPPTVTLYFNSPKEMDGFMREKVAKLMKLDIAIIDDIANGKIKTIKELHELVAL